MRQNFASRIDANDVMSASRDSLLEKFPANQKRKKEKAKNY